MVSEEMMRSRQYLFSSLIAIIIFSPTCIAQHSKIYPGFQEKINKFSNIDTGSKILVSAINVAGNKKTKTYIILREMQFRSGDSIIASRLSEILQQSRSLIYNTSLFSEVELYPVWTDSAFSVNVVVKEKWYIYPTPEFKLVDRNFNDWLKTYHASLDRVTYGGKFVHYNFSGRGDQLKVYLLNGYSRSIAGSYTAPYSNPKLTEGFSIAAAYTQNRETVYATDYDNKLLQFKKDGFVKKALTLSATYQLRRGYYTKHIFLAAYNYITVDDSLITALYNPNYFHSKKSGIGFPEISYNFSYSNTDNVHYPLQGKIFNALLLKRGYAFTGNVNMLSLDTRFSKYDSYSKGWYGTVQFLSTLKIPFRTAYINQRALGYGDLYLRGLEYYVIDGVAAAIGKYTLRKKIFSFSIPVPFHIKAIPKIPFTFFAKIYADAGYDYTPKEYDSKLNNRFLYTSGFGVDVLTFYDLNLSLEYSFNQLGENGLFLHVKSSF